jgi:agmatine/peptidylarginine deiminase
MTCPTNLKLYSKCITLPWMKIGLKDRQGRQHVNTFTKFASQTQVQQRLKAVETSRLLNM